MVIKKKFEIKKLAIRFKLEFKSSKTKITHLIRNNSQIIIILTLLLLGFIPISLQNYIIKDVSIVSTILSAIIGASASILGIVTAVLILSLEILRRKYAGRAIQEFFKTKLLKGLYVAFISTILTSILSLSQIDPIIEESNFYLIYLSIGLFIYSILILFPHLKKILTSSVSNSKIIEIVNDIDYRDINENNELYLGTHKDKFLDILENNPLLQLEEMIINSISNNDRKTPIRIIIELSKKLESIINSLTEMDYRRDYINGFTHIFGLAVKESIYHNQYEIAFTTIGEMRNLHLLFADKKVKWSDMIEFNETFNSIVKYALLKDADKIVTRCLHTYAGINNAHFKKNTPKEDDIWDMRIRKGLKRDEKVDHDISLHWQHVSDDYIRNISNICEEAISLNMVSVVRTGLSAIDSINTFVIQSKSLGDYQKEYILRNSYYSSTNILEQCIPNKNMKSIIRYIHRSWVVDKALDENTIYSKIPLTSLGKILQSLSKAKKLNYMLLNDLGTVGRGCVRKVHKNKLNRESVEYISEVFNRLRKDIGEPITDYDFRILKDIYSQQQSLLEFMERTKVEDKPTSILIKDMLEKFGDIRTIEEQIKSEVKWPKI